MREEPNKEMNQEPILYDKDTIVEEELLNLCSRHQLVDCKHQLVDCRHQLVDQIYILQEQTAGHQELHQNKEWWL